MAKKLHKVQLVGMDKSGNVVKSSDADKVVRFVGGKEGYFEVTLCDNLLGVEVVTPKGRYHVPINSALNIFQGVLKGTKVHISLKKIVGELRYWA